MTGSATTAAVFSSRQRMGGERNVCFDDPIVTGLTVHVCGSCAALARASQNSLGLGAPARKPCE
jgi:hypothetical protein